MNDADQAIATFLETKVQPEFRPLVEKFRALVQHDFPELSEEMRGGTEKYYSTPVYRLKHIVITLSPSKQGITYAFTDGKQLEDKYAILEGVGNKTRNIRLKHADDFNDEIMRYYIRQAITLDQAG